jgi:hypothetical protein
MDLVPATAPRLDEEIIAREAPVVRAEIWRRYEELWKMLQPFIDGGVDEDGLVRRPDPRLVDSALRVLADLRKVWRLDVPSRPDPEKAAQLPAEVLAKVEAQLAELEARARA